MQLKGGSLWRVVVMALLHVLVLFAIPATNSTANAGAQTSVAAGAGLDPKLDAGKIIEMSWAFAKNTRGHGVQEKVYIQSVEYQVDSRQWRVFFREKESNLEFDGCFTIYVNDLTKEHRLRSCPLH